MQRRKGLHRERLRRERARPKGSRVPREPLTLPLAGVSVAAGGCRQGVPEEKETMPPQSSEGCNASAETPTGLGGDDFPLKSSQ